MFRVICLYLSFYLVFPPQVWALALQQQGAQQTKPVLPSGESSKAPVIAKPADTGDTVPAAKLPVAPKAAEAPVVLAGADGDPMRKPLQAFHLAAWKLTYLYRQWMPQFEAVQAKTYFQLFKPYASCGNPLASLPATTAEFDKEVFVPLLTAFADYLAARRSELKMDFTQSTSRALLMGQPPVTAENGEVCYLASHREEAASLASGGVDNYTAWVQMFESMSNELARPHFEELIRLDRRHISRAEVTMWFNWLYDLQGQRQIFALLFETRGAKHEAPYPTLAIPDSLAKQLNAGVQREKETTLERAKLLQQANPGVQISEADILTAVDGSAEFGPCGRDSSIVKASVSSEEPVLCLAKPLDWDNVTPRDATLVSLYAPTEMSYGVQIDALRKDRLHGLLSVFAATNSLLGEQALALPQACVVARDLAPYTRYYRELLQFTEPRWWAGQLDRATHAVEEGYRDGKLTVPVPESDEFYDRGQEIIAEVFKNATVAATFQESGVTGDPGADVAKVLNDQIQDYTFHDYVSEALAKTPWKNTYALRLAEKLRVWTFLFRNEFESIGSVEERMALLKARIPAIIRSALVDTARDYLVVTASRVRDVLVELPEEQIVLVWEDYFRSRWEESLELGALKNDVDRIAKSVFESLAASEELKAKFDPKQIQDKELTAYVANVRAKSRDAVQVKDTLTYLQNLIGWEKGPASLLPLSGTYDNALAGGKEQRRFEPNKTIHLQIDDGHGHGLGATMPEFDPSQNNDQNQDYLHLKKVLNAVADAQLKELVKQLKAKGWTDTRVHETFGARNVPSVERLALLVIEKFKRMVHSETGSDWQKVRINRKKALTPLRSALTDGRLRGLYKEGGRRFAEYLYRSYFEPVLQAKSSTNPEKWAGDVAARVALVREAELFLGQPEPKKVVEVLSKYESKLAVERSLEAASRKQQMQEFIASTRREKHLESLAAWLALNKNDPEKAKLWVDQLSDFFHPLELQKLYTARFVTLTEMQTYTVMNALKLAGYPDPVPARLQPLLDAGARTVAEVWQGYPVLDDDVRPQLFDIWKRLAARAKANEQIDSALFEERENFFALAASLYPKWEKQLRERLDRLKAAVDSADPQKLFLALKDARALTVGGELLRIDRYQPVSILGKDIPFPRSTAVSGELWLIVLALDRQVPLVREEFFREFAGALLPDYETFRSELSTRISAIVSAEGGSARFELRRANERIQEIKDELEQISNERKSRKEQSGLKRAFRQGAEALQTMVAQTRWETQAAQREATLNRELSVVQFRHDEAEKVWRYETQFSRLLRNYFLSPNYAGVVPEMPDEINRANSLAQAEGGYEGVYREYVGKLFLDSKVDPRGDEMDVSPRQTFDVLDRAVSGARRHAKFVPSRADSFLASLDKIVDLAVANEKQSETRYAKVTSNLIRLSQFDWAKRPLQVLGDLNELLNPATELPANPFAKAPPGQVGLQMVPTFAQYSGYLKSEILALREQLKPVLANKVLPDHRLVEKYWILVQRASVVFLDRSEQFGPAVDDEGNLVWFDETPTDELHSEFGGTATDTGTSDREALPPTIITNSASDLDVTRTLIAFVKKPRLENEAIVATFGSSLPEDLVGRFRAINAFSPAERRSAYEKLRSYLFARLSNKDGIAKPAFGEPETVDAAMWSKNMQTLLMQWREIKAFSSQVGREPNQDPMFTLLARTLVGMFLRHAKYDRVSYCFDGQSITAKKSLDQTPTKSLELFAQAKPRVQVRAVESIEAAVVTAVRRRLLDAQQVAVDEVRARNEIGLPQAQIVLDQDAVLLGNAQDFEATKSLKGAYEERELLFYLSEYANEPTPAAGAEAVRENWLREARATGGLVLVKELETFDFDPSVGSVGQRERFEAWWANARTAKGIEKSYQAARQSILEGKDSASKALLPFVEKFDSLTALEKSTSFTQVKAILTLSDQNGEKILHDDKGKGYLIPETYPYFLVHLAWNAKVKDQPISFGAVAHPMMPTEGQLSYLMNDMIDLLKIDVRDFNGWQKLLADPKLVTPTELLLLAQSKLAKLVYASGSLQTRVPNVYVQNPVWGGTTYGYRPLPIVDSYFEPWSSAKSPERSTLTTPLSFNEYLGRVESPAYTQLYRATANDLATRPLYEAQVAAELERGSEARLNSNLHLRDEFIRAKADWTAARFGGHFTDERVLEFTNYVARLGITISPKDMRMILETRDAVVHFDSILSESIPQYGNESRQFVPGPGNDLVHNQVNVQDFLGDYQQALERLAKQLQSQLDVPNLRHMDPLGSGMWERPFAWPVFDRRRIGVASANYWAGLIAYEKLFQGLNAEEMKRRQTVIAAIDNKMREDSQKRVALEDGVMTVAKNTQEALEAYCSEDARSLREIRTLQQLEDKKRYLLDKLKLPFGDNLLEQFAQFIFTPKGHGDAASGVSAIAWMKQKAQEEHESAQLREYLSTYAQSVGAVLLAGIIFQRVNPMMSGWAMRGAMGQIGMLSAGVAVTGMFLGVEGLQIYNDFFSAPEEIENLTRARDTVFPAPEGMAAQITPFMKEETGMGLAFRDESVSEIQRDKLRWSMHVFFATTILLPLVRPGMKLSGRILQRLSEKASRSFALNNTFRRSLRRLGLATRSEGEGAYKAAQAVKEMRSDAQLTLQLGELPGVTRVSKDVVRLDAEAARVYREKALVDLQKMSEELGLAPYSGYSARFYEGSGGSALFEGIPGVNRIPLVNRVPGLGPVRYEGTPLLNRVPLLKSVPGIRPISRPDLYIANQRLLKRDGLNFLRKMVAKLEGENPEILTQEIIQLYKGNIDPAANHISPLLEVLGVTSISRRLTERVLSNGADLRLMRETAELVQAHQELLRLHSPSMWYQLVALHSLRKQKITRGDLSLPSGAALAKIPRDVRSLLSNVKMEAEALAREASLARNGSDVYSEQYWIDVIGDTNSLIKSALSGSRITTDPKRIAFIQKFHPKFQTLAGNHKALAQYTDMWLVENGLAISKQTELLMEQVSALADWRLRYRKVIDAYAADEGLTTEEVMRSILLPGHPEHKEFTRLILAERPEIAVRTGNQSVVFDQSSEDTVGGAAHALRELFDAELWVVDPRVVRALASGDPRQLADHLVPYRVIENETTGQLSAELTHAGAPKIKPGANPTGPKPGPTKFTANPERVALARTELADARRLLGQNIDQLPATSSAQADELRRRMLEIDRLAERLTANSSMDDEFAVLVQMRDEFQAALKVSEKALTVEATAPATANLNPNAYRRSDIDQRGARLQQELFQWSQATGSAPSQAVQERLREVEQLLAQANAARSAGAIAEERSLLESLRKSFDALERLTGRLISEPPAGGWTEETNRLLRARFDALKIEVERESARVGLGGAPVPFKNPSAMRGVMLRRQEAGVAAAEGMIEREAQLLIELNQTLIAELDHLSQTAAFGINHVKNADALFPITARMRRQYEVAKRYLDAFDKKSVQRLKAAQQAELKPLETKFQETLRACDLKVATKPGILRSELEAELAAEAEAADRLAFEYHQKMAALNDELVAIATPVAEDSSPAVVKTIRKRFFEPGRGELAKVRAEYDAALAAARSSNPGSADLDRMTKYFDDLIQSATKRIGPGDATGDVWVEMRNLESMLIDMTAELKKPFWKALAKPAVRPISTSGLTKMTLPAPRIPKPPSAVSEPPATAPAAEAGLEVLPALDSAFFGSLHKAAQKPFEEVSNALVKEAVARLKPEESAVDVLRGLAAIPARQDLGAMLEAEDAVRAAFFARRAMDIVARAKAIRGLPNQEAMVQGLVGRWNSGHRYQLTLAEARVRLKLPLGGKVTEESLDAAVAKALGEGMDQAMAEEAKDLVSRLAMEGSPGPESLDDLLAAAEIPIEFLSPNTVGQLTQSAVTSEQKLASAALDQLASNKIALESAEARARALGLGSDASKEQMLSRVESLEKSVSSAIAEEASPASPGARILKQIQRNLELLKGKL